MENELKDLIKRLQAVSAEGYAFAGEAADTLSHQSAEIARLTQQVDSLQEELAEAHDYVDHYREERDRLEAQVAAQTSAEPVAVVESFTCGSYHRNYKLRWLRDVPENTDLYAGRQPAAAANSQQFEDWFASEFPALSSAANGGDGWSKGDTAHACLSRGNMRRAWEAGSTAQPAVAKSDAAITACVLMIRGICMTRPQDVWNAEIEKRIRFMLSGCPAITKEQTS
jgi:hypothetical protein